MKLYEAIKERFKDAIADNTNQICAEADAYDEKIQKQFKERYDLMNYGYWCGRKNAPAKQPVNMEPYIPEDESEWEDWIKKKCLPPPIDDLDHVCMLHDLRLGRARQTDSDLNANSRHHLVNKAHQQLLEDFGQAGKNKKLSGKARFYACRGIVAFKFMVWKTSCRDE
ncbi:hypothetical protein QUF72_11630 [Desulfobacterales bacterium HSG2]|nr:hypothetical protein [Desulfobacterales bacterium HSG2]